MYAKYNSHGFSGAVNFTPVSSHQKNTHILRDAYNLYIKSGLRTFLIFESCKGFNMSNENPCFVKKVFSFVA